MVATAANQWGTPIETGNKWLRVRVSIVEGSKDTTEVFEGSKKAKWFNGRISTGSSLWPLPLE